MPRQILPGHFYLNSLTPPPGAGMIFHMASESILHTKLMPPRLHATLLRRADLFARLDAGLTKKVTLVSAPTGFGKTTLVSAWLAERGLPAAWVTLDANDNDPVRFWTYVTTALHNVDPAIGRATLSALTASPPPAAFQPLLTPLLNDLAQRTQPAALVLEDYHVITNGEIQAALAFLLQHLPASLHLVLVTRAEPDLPLGILRARDELAELTADDLRFSPAETDAFLRETLGAAIPAGAAEKLQERTEGWAAGLRLASLSLQGKSGAEAERVIASFSGSHRHVADYLIREVFESQSEAVRSFLLHTCFLGRLTGALCDSITGSADGESMLEQLERGNLFLVRLEHGRGRAWYRYNPLFAESIQSLARQVLGEAGVRSIYEKASAWYASQQMLDEAIEAALAADQPEEALTLVERFIEIYSLNEMGTLARWMERIPQALTLAHPAVCMMFAQVILFTADRYAPATATRIEPYLQAAETIWGAQGDEEKVGTVLALRGMMLIWQGQFQRAMECVDLALEKMAENEIFWRGISLLNAAGGDLNAGRMSGAQDKILEARAYLGAAQNIYGLMAATSILAEVLYFQGDLEQSAQLTRQLMDEAVGDESMLDDQGEARRILANVLYEQNELESAGQYAAEARDLARQRGNELLEAQVVGRLALVQAAQGRAEQGQNELRTLAARLQSRLARREVLDTQALLSVRDGDLQALNSWLGTITTEKDNLLFQQRERESFILARLRLAEGQPAEALALLAPLSADAAEQSRLHSLAQALCLQALAQRAAGEASLAIATLARALDIGHEKGFRRVFLDEGAPLAALLRELVPALPDRAPSTRLRAGLSLYAATLLHLFPPEALPMRQGLAGSVALVEPLSGQELRVLRLLAAGLSNGDIASELVVSTNTIKTHVKSIYRKLDVNSREEARLVAKELKLL